MNWRTWLPILAIVLVAVFALTFSSTSIVTHPPSVASPTPALSTSSAPGASSATTSVPTTPAKPSTADLAAISARNLTAAGGNLLKSIVNIFCTPKNGSKLPGASGTGVIIDSRGLILTAAHIGQYFLLTNYPNNGDVSCIIRTGAPATDAYTATLVYLSPSWLDVNSDTLVEKAPKGTGENDFAILAITDTATIRPLPQSFNFVPLGTDVPKVGNKMAIGGYAAQYLGRTDIQWALYPTIVFDKITNRYTFATSTVDVLAIAGTAAAQEGSSGGGIVDEHNQLVGLITTSSVSGDISQHILHAITPRHIRASFMSDSAVSLDSYLASNDIKTLVTNFSSELKLLQQTLATAIAK